MIRFTRNYKATCPEQKRIVELLAKKYGVPPLIVKMVIRSFFVAFRNNLIRGKRVAIPGLFVYQINHKQITMLKKVFRKKKKKF